MSATEVEAAASKKRVVREPGVPTHCIMFNFPWPSNYEPQKLASAMNYEADSDDVVINTYPKCGTTWVQNICLQLMLGQKPQAGGKEMLWLSPMLDYSGAEFVKKVARPRLIKTHFRYNQMKFGDVNKIIFVARNPKDVLVSYFYHHKAFHHYEYENSDFDKFYDLFMHKANEKLDYGCYLDFLESWLPHLNDPTVLTLIYEEMLIDLASNVRKIAAFLGGEAEQKANDPLIFDEVVSSSTLAEMKGKDHVLFPPEALTSQPFIRKGIAKDWLNHLSDEQSKEIDEIFKKRFSGTIFERCWKEVMKK